MGKSQSSKMILINNWIDQNKDIGVLALYFRRDIKRKESETIREGK